MGHEDGNRARECVVGLREIVMLSDDMEFQVQVRFKVVVESGLPGVSLVIK